MLTLRRLRWPRSAGQAKGHAIVLALILWIVAAVVGFTGTGDRGIAGPLKGADFVQFYTLGHLASAHRIAPMYDGALLHEAQVAFIPESNREIYPPVYPPQAAVMFAPLSGLSYQRALLIWSLLTIGGYALIVWSAWKPVADRLPDRVFVIAAAAAFPPFWSLVLHGQLTLVLLAAFWAGWIALERRRHWLAGVALGLLAIKPQFGIPLAVVAVACGEWAMIAGAVSSVLAQAAAVWSMLGSDAFAAFAASIPTTIAYADQLEAKPFLSHSLRALTRLTPNWFGLPLWAILTAIVLWYHGPGLEEPSTCSRPARNRDPGIGARQPAHDHLRPGGAGVAAPVVWRLHAGACPIGVEPEPTGKLSTGSSPRRSCRPLRRSACKPPSSSWSVCSYW